MDYSSIDSELIESLDFLRPPVKRVFKSTNKSTFTNLESRINNIKVLKDFRKKISKDCQFPQSKVRSAESSTSLILKKTTERDIVQKYSVLSYTNLLGSSFQQPKISPAHSPTSKEKPLIKVTVIPKTAHTQPSNTFKKQKHFPKRIHTTVSNQENSIQTKNLFLVVQGRKREKVYEIKTTGSAKFINTRSKNDFKDEVIPIEQLSSLKLVLDSLNMDRDIEKDRRGKKTDADTLVEFSNILKDNEKYSECKCWNRGKEKSRKYSCLNEVQGEGASDIRDSKSRVRIIGQLGMTEDERYVLRCGATVNDIPVPTSYLPVQTAPYVCSEERKFNVCDRDSCIPRCYNAAAYCTQKKDFNMQADLQNKNICEMVSKERVTQCKESQATQVNFNTGLLDVPKCMDRFMNKDEIIQCCRTNIDTHASLTDSDSDSNSVKACQSPLVIISVYPMQDCCETVKVLKKYPDDSKCSSPQKINVLAQCSGRSRPNSGNKPNKKTDNKVSKPSRSPSPQNKNVSKSNVTETRVTKTNTRKVSPGREVTPSPLRTNRPIKNNQDKPDLTKNQQRNVPAQIKESKGINTDHQVTKKFLVDSYTKKLTDYLKSENSETKFRFPRSDPSKVTVDIDGDNEYYNVLFQQANSTTDLNVKKTVKTNTNKKSTENVKVTAQTENNLISQEEPKRRLSPVHNKNQQKDDKAFEQKLDNKFSRLQVKDSIEIFHRRDYKPPVDHAVNQNSKIDDDSGQFSAPIKHYRGDSCPIADPIKRDKEIRALLGVDKAVHTSTTPDIKHEEKNFTVPLHYFYGNRCAKKIITGINIMEMPEPPCVCCDIRKFYDSNSNIRLQQQQYQTNQQQLNNHFSAPQRTPSLHNKKLNTTSSQIDKETAQQVPASSDSASQEENNPPMEKSEEESPSPMEDSPSPLEETPSPVVEKVPTKKHVSKSTKKSRANSTGTQYENQVQRTSLYQQLILNRNIQVFLQVEQFSKQKPIILSRKQYDKVKRTIESTIANKTGRDYKRKKCICKTSLVSVGNVRRKTNPGQPLHYDKQSQTDKKELANNAKKSSNVSNRSKSSRRKHSKTFVLFSKEAKNTNEEKTPVTPRQAKSSMEIQYASLSYMRRVTFSSTNVEVGSTGPLPLQQKESHSIHTIFKGRRKCPTPNLGTSVYSLYSEDNNAFFSPKPEIVPQESKQKKPFLRRLMSCLVMRSGRVSEPNIVNPPVKVPSIDSSIDSYHISTSLGAIEVSSSIYDTSASFYSNHSVYPVNSKMKRGFFSSVREFLTNRKS